MLLMTLVKRCLCTSVSSFTLHNIDREYVPCYPHVRSGAMYLIVMLRETLDSGYCNTGDNELEA
jgi:hypothetical protein